MDFPLILTALVDMIWGLKVNNNNAEKMARKDFFFSSSRSFFICKLTFLKDGPICIESKAAALRRRAMLPAVPLRSRGTL